MVAHDPPLPPKMKAALHAHSVSYWMHKLKDKDAAWLDNQFLYGVAEYNGPNYYTAVCRSRESKGDVAAPPPTKQRLATWGDEEDDYIIQHVPSGPKGMTERVKVPRSVFTG